MFFALVQQNHERNEFRVKNHACILILYFKYGNIKKYKCLGSLGEKPKVGFFLIEQAFFGKFCPGPIKRPSWNIFEKLINVLSLIRASWVEQMLKINKIVQPYYSELQSKYMYLLTHRTPLVQSQIECNHLLGVCSQVFTTAQWPAGRRES